VEGRPEHVHHLPCVRVLAWGELDVHCVGGNSCASVLAAVARGEESAEYRGHSGLAKPEGAAGDGVDVCGGDRGVGVFSGGELGDGVGVPERLGADADSRNAHSASELHHNQPRVVHVGCGTLGTIC